MKIRRLLAVAAGVASVAAAALLYGANNEEDMSKTALENQLSEALKTRAASAGAAYDTMMRAYSAQRRSLNDLVDAANKLRDAELAWTDSPDEEIAALERHVKRTRQTEIPLKVTFRNRTGADEDYYTARRERESAQIEWLKSRIKAKQQ